MDINLIAGLMLPFLGTALGSGMVFFMRQQFSRILEKFLSGFAAGVMVAASVWSLLIPSIDMAASQGKAAWLPAAAGFILGIIFLSVTDHMLPFLRTKAVKAWTFSERAKGTAMMIFAVTLHNIPEGMAVGVAFAGAILENSQITMTGATALALGIAIQNFPEGAIISMPLRSEGTPSASAFLYGVLSGLVEPVGAVLTILIAGLVVPLLPYFLAFAAGCMIYVVVAELIPASQAGEYAMQGIAGVTAGFVVMMVLDVALG